MIGPCYEVPCFDMSYFAFFPSLRLAQVKHICRFVGQNGMEGVLSYNTYLASCFGYIV